MFISAHSKLCRFKAFFIPKYTDMLKFYCKSGFCLINGLNQYNASFYIYMYIAKDFYFSLGIIIFLRVKRAHRK